MTVTYVYDRWSAREREECETLEAALDMAIRDIYQLQGWPRMIVIDGVPSMYMRRPRWGEDDWHCVGPNADDLKTSWERACERYIDELVTLYELRHPHRGDHVPDF